MKRKNYTEGRYYKIFCSYYNNFYAKKSQGVWNIYTREDNDYYRICGPFLDIQGIDRAKHEDEEDYVYMLLEDLNEKCYVKELVSGEIIKDGLCFEDLKTAIGYGSVDYLLFHNVKKHHFYALSFSKKALSVDLYYEEKIEFGKEFAMVDEKELVYYGGEKVDFSSFECVSVKLETEMDESDYPESFRSIDVFYQKEKNQYWISLGLFHYDEFVKDITESEDCSTLIYITDVEKYNYHNYAFRFYVDKRIVKLVLVDTFNYYRGFSDPFHNV